MNKYSKGNKVIFATEKAYKTLYEKQGYKPISEKKTREKAEIETEPKEKIEVE